MGRFYKTAQPEFIDNFVYQPPWQLMNQVMATKQQGYDNAMQSTELIKNMLDIKHLRFEDDRAKELKEYYNGKIDELTTQLAKNPNEYNKIMPVIKNLARELDTDRKEGNISKIEGRYNWLQQKQKDNAEVLKTDPEAYNRMLKYEYSDLVNRASKDINAAGGTERYVAKPDMNSKELRDLFNNFKATKLEEMSQDGRWKYTTTEAKDSEIQHAFWQEYNTNPKVKEYIRQGLLTKAPGFYDSTNDTPIELWQYKDSKGNILTQEQVDKLREDYNKLSPEERQKNGLPYNYSLNMGHSLASGIKGYGDIYGFKNTEVEENKGWLNQQQHNNKIDEIKLTKSLDSQLQKQKDASAYLRILKKGEIDMSKLIKQFELKDAQKRADFENDLKKIIIENGKDSDVGVNATKALEEINIGNTFGKFKSPKVSYNTNLENALSGDNIAIQNESNARETSKKQLNIKEGTVENRFLDYMDGKRMAGFTDKEKLAREFAAEEIKSEYKNMLLGEYNEFSPIITAPHEKRLTDRLLQVHKKYEKEKSNFFENTVTQDVDLHPTSTSGNIRITNTLNNNLESYNFTDGEGNILEPKQRPSKVISSDYAMSSNPMSSIGIKINTDKGIMYAIPKTDNKADYETIRRTILDNGLLDKNSPLYKEYSDGEYMDLMSTIDRTIPIVDKNTGVSVKKVMYNIPNSDLKIPIHVKNGRYYIVNPDNINDVTDLGTDARVLKNVIFGN